MMPHVIIYESSSPEDLGQEYFTKFCLCLREIQDQQHRAKFHDWAII